MRARSGDIPGRAREFSSMPFSRYRTFIPDAEWGAFEASLTRREPRTLRVRRGRIEPETLAELLRAQGFQTTSVEGLPDVLRVHTEPFPISETVEHWLGLFYLQQASTCVAAPVLAPLPGEGILDLCAAPGGKTTHLAELMGDDGCIVAVDSAPSRLEILSGNVARLGHTSIMAVVRDGLRVPESASFHRVLADVPCSGEGRSRKDLVKVASRGDLRRLPVLQEALLRKALALTVPGGHVLYVTCTLAPEENEGVVDAVLRAPELDGGVRLIPVTPDLASARGLTRFEGARYADELEATCRIHPHHLDSGGLFLALLERGGGPPPSSAIDLAGWSPTSAFLPGEGRRSEGIRTEGHRREGRRTEGRRTEGRRPEGRRAEGRRAEQQPSDNRRSRRNLPLPSPALARASTLEDRLREGRAHLDALVKGSLVAAQNLQVLDRGDALRVHSFPAWPLDGWREEDPQIRVISAGLRAFDLSRDGAMEAAPDLLRWVGTGEGPGRLNLSTATWLNLLDGVEVTAHEVGVDLSQDVPSRQDVPSLLLQWRSSFLARGRIRGGRLFHDLPPARAQWLRVILERQGEAHRTGSA
jgi:16S rRNA C967 or C1407 C5-methylase (RsmB/RsmF family)